MKRILLAWIGKTDLRAVAESDKVGLGPIAQALTARRFDEALLLSNFPEAKTIPFVRWIREITATRIRTVQKPLSGPTKFSEIYQAARNVLSETVSRFSQDKLQITFHLSPGTPAMAAVWIILAKTRFPAELIESSQEHGVQTVSVPFDLAADFIPDLLQARDRELQRYSFAEPPNAPEFADIIHRSSVMKRVISMARRVAPRSFPVLLEGETGTGKELMARAIHRASTRCAQAFVSVNCGAIPSELVEAELFGHEKGAFTGALAARPGYFEIASGGSLFLDEVGELPLPTQVKLLRAIQEREIRRIGSVKTIPIDLRIIAATNRNLLNEVAAGRFREDLFYRLAVAVIRLPALREREGDISLLIDQFLRKINEETANESGYQQKSLSAAARKLLLNHTWPGNVRELLNTLLRVTVWSEGEKIEPEDVREAILPEINAPKEDILERPLGSGLNLNKVLSSVARHYLKRAMEEAHGNKTRAAQLLGLSNYQTLANWLKRYQVEFGTKRAH